MIINMVRFRVWDSLRIRLLNVVVLIGLRFVVGLFRKSILGFSVRVWVRVVCLCILFDSLDG